MSGLDALRVKQANELYRISALIYNLCCEKGILCMIEKPRRSHFWAIRDMAAIKSDYSLHASCHHCTMGSKRRKATLLLANFPRVCLLRLLCDGSHEHEPWGKVGHKFATASETAYPPLMCALIAQAFHKELLRAGVLPDSDNLHDSAPSLARAASVAVGKQPKGKSLLPLMPERLCGQGHLCPFLLACRAGPSSLAKLMRAAFRSIACQIPCAQFPSCFSGFA